MQHFLRKIDAGGWFVEDVFFDDEATDEKPGLPIPPDLIAVDCPGGFYRPKWDGAAWVEGGTPSQVIPQAVTMRQARLALLGAGLLDAVELAIQSAGPAAKIEWEYAQEVQRSAGLVPAMAVALGMTDAQLDALFLQAATL